jgi:hypothetical protein
MNFCLLAIGGDCSAGAMSDKADFIPLHDLNETLVEYLKNQLERDIKGYNDINFDDPDFLAVIEQHHKLGNELIDQGIFAHKWHKRTDWIICELENELPLNHSGPFNRCDVKGESK